jgi:hypothetical protein
MSDIEKTNMVKLQPWKKVKDGVWSTMGEDGEDYLAFVEYEPSQRWVQADGGYWRSLNAEA